MKAYLYVSLVLFSFVFSVPVYSGERSSETLNARKGVFRLLSADVNERLEYNFRTSMQYFQQKGLLEDSATLNSTVKRTKAVLGFGFALLENIYLNGHLGFHSSGSTPEPGAPGATPGTLSLNFIRGGIGAIGTYDVGQYWFDLPKNKFTAGFALDIDLSKMTRIFKSLGVIPTFILSGSFLENNVVPFRTHLNFGFIPSNGDRYFEDNDLNVTDFDRFATNTFNSHAITAAWGIEFPFYVITPSVEAHIQKTLNSSFMNSPKWVTVGLKGRPFPQKNIDLMAGVDIGLSTFDGAAAGTKPDVYPIPLWNAVIGFGLSQFGKRPTDIDVDRIEYNNMRKKLSQSEDKLEALSQDLQYNTIQGRVVDAKTKQPLSGVLISFPERSDLKSSYTDENGLFTRYFRSFAGTRIQFSKDGLAPSSKFVALKPGESTTIGVELQESSGELLVDFVANVTDENGSGIESRIQLINAKTLQTTTLSTDRSGRFVIKVQPGNYRLTVSAPGYLSLRDNLSVQPGRAVLKTYTMTSNQ